MAGLRKLRGKWYVRVWLPGHKEKLIPTRTGDRRLAESWRRKVEEREFLVRARLLESPLEAKTIRLFAAINEYLKDCKTRLREQTYLNYGLALQNLQACWGNLPLKDIAPTHYTAFRSHLTSRVSDTSANIRLGVARTFLNWLVSTGKLDHLPGKLSLIRVDEQLPKFFTPDELDRIMEQITTPEIKAAIIILAELGLRRSELFNCTLEDGFLHLRQTKGRRDRLVALPPDLVPDFYLATENPYHVESISRALRLAMRAAGIERKGRSLHTLRHTFALREYYRTGDIYYVKGLLGHSTVAVTERYLRFPDEYLRQVFGDRVERHPGREMMPYQRGRGWGFKG